MPLIIPKEPQTSYVYIIHCDDLPFIKCGISNNIKQRLCAYKTSHWNIITKRLYLIPDTKKLKEIEK
jgi:predicted GIY-YIG superfamily endonuclease